MRKFAFVIPMLILSFSANAKLSDINNLRQEFDFDSFKTHQFAGTFLIISPGMIQDLKKNLTPVSNFRVHKGHTFKPVKDVDIYLFDYERTPFAFHGKWDYSFNNQDWFRFGTDDRLFGNIGFIHDGFSSKHHLFNGCVPAIPEPQTWLMMLSGLAVLGLAVKHRRKITK